MARAATVLCVMDRPQSGLCRSLRNHGFKVFETYSADHAVALCAAHQVDAVVLHQGTFTEVGGWSLSQSIKLVNKGICVLLVTEARFLGRRLPKGVDKVISSSHPREVLATLEAVLPRTKAGK